MNKNRHAAALGKLGGRKRYETGGKQAMSEMGKRAAASQNRPKFSKEYYQRLQALGVEAKILKKMGKANG